MPNTRETLNSFKKEREEKEQEKDTTASNYQEQAQDAKKFDDDKSAEAPDVEPTELDTPVEPVKPIEPPAMGI